MFLIVDIMSTKRNRGDATTGAAVEESDKRARGATEPAVKVSSDKGATTVETRPNPKKGFSIMIGDIAKEDWSRCLECTSSTIAKHWHFKQCEQDLQSRILQDQTIGLKVLRDTTSIFALFNKDVYHVRDTKIRSPVPHPNRPLFVNVLEGELLTRQKPFRQTPFMYYRLADDVLINGEFKSSLLDCLEGDQFLNQWYLANSRCRPEEILIVFGRIYRKLHTGEYSTDPNQMIIYRDPKKVVEELVRSQDLSTMMKKAESINSSLSTIREGLQDILAMDAILSSPDVDEKEIRAINTRLDLDLKSRSRSIVTATTTATPTGLSEATTTATPSAGSSGATMTAAIITTTTALSGATATSTTTASTTSSIEMTTTPAPSSAASIMLVKSEHSTSSAAAASGGHATIKQEAVHQLKTQETFFGRQILWEINDERIYGAYIGYTAKIEGSLTSLTAVSFGKDSFLFCDRLFQSKGTKRIIFSMGDAMRLNAEKFNAVNHSTMTNPIFKWSFLIIGGLFPRNCSKKKEAEIQGWIILAYIRGNSFYRIPLQAIPQFLIYPSLGEKGPSIMNTFFTLRADFISGPEKRSTENMPPILELPSS
jgi:hypothetical protein